MEAPQLGRALIGLGLLLALVGAVLLVGGRLGLGRLPGDLVLRRQGFTFYAPLATSIVVSLLLTLLLNLWSRRR